MSARRSLQLFLDSVTTPIGAALLVSDTQDVLRALDFADYEHRMLRLLRIHYGDVDLRPRPATRQVRAALTHYFEGELTALQDVPWRTAGTAFQQSVWQALTTIVAGSTTTYGALAQALGVPKAARAVGLANGSNPLGIIVPCHRVIGADGSLTGYGGGLHRKDWLLRHEAAFAAAGGGPIPPPAVGKARNC